MSPPPWPRVLLLALAFLLFAHALGIAGTVGEGDERYSVQRVGYSGFLAVALVVPFLVGDLLRRGGRSAVLALAAIGLSAVVAVVFGNPNDPSPVHPVAPLRATAFSAMMAAVVVVPPFALSAFEGVRPAARRVAAAGSAAYVLLAVGPEHGANALRHGGAAPWQETLASWWTFPPLLLGLAIAAAAVAGALAFAALARSTRRPDVRPVGPFAPSWPIGVGAALLGVAWLLGGGLYLGPPLWPLALAFLAAPAFTQARTAVLAGAILLLGFVPVATCTVVEWTDAIVVGGPPEPTYPRNALLAEVAGNGPWWREGGGFSGSRVDCPPYAVALAVLWVGGLAAVSSWRRSRGPEPTEGER